MEKNRKSYPIYSLKLTNSPVFEEIPFEDVINIKPLIGKNGKPILQIDFYDSEYCYKHTTTCDEIEIKKELKEI